MLRWLLLRTTLMERNDIHTTTMYVKFWFLSCWSLGSSWFWIEFDLQEDVTPEMAVDIVEMYRRGDSTSRNLYPVGTQDPRRLRCGPSGKCTTLRGVPKAPPCRDLDACWSLHLSPWSVDPVITNIIDEEEHLASWWENKSEIEQTITLDICHAWKLTSKIILYILQDQASVQLNLLKWFIINYYVKYSFKETDCWFLKFNFQWQLSLSR